MTSLRVDDAIVAPSLAKPFTIFLAIGRLDRMAVLISGFTKCPRRENSAPNPDPLWRECPPGGRKGNINVLILVFLLVVL